MMNQMNQMNPNQMMNPSQMMPNQNPHMNINPNMNSMMTPISQMGQPTNQSSQNNPMNQIPGQMAQSAQVGYFYANQNYGIAPIIAGLNLRQNTLVSLSFPLGSLINYYFC